MLVLDCCVTVYKVNKIVLAFIWNHKPPKIKFWMLNKTRQEEGLEMKDFSLFNQALKLNWVKQLCSNSSAPWKYSRLSLNGHLSKTDTSVKQTLRVGPCLSLLPLFDFLYDGHLSKTDTYCRSQRCPSWRELTVHSKVPHCQCWRAFQ